MIDNGFKKLMVCHIVICRQNDKLSVYGTTANARALMLQVRPLDSKQQATVARAMLCRHSAEHLGNTMQELRGLILDNPALRGKMDFPPIPPSALASVFAQL